MKKIELIDGYRNTPHITSDQVRKHNDKIYGTLWIEDDTDSGTENILVQNIDNVCNFIIRPQILVAFSARAEVTEEILLPVEAKPDYYIAELVIRFKRDPISSIESLYFDVVTSDSYATDENLDLDAPLTDPITNIKTGESNEGVLPVCRALCRGGTFIKSRSLYSLHWAKAHQEQNFITGILPKVLDGERRLGQVEDIKKLSTSDVWTNASVEWQSTTGMDGCGRTSHGLTVCTFHIKVTAPLSAGATPTLLLRINNLDFRPLARVAISGYSTGTDGNLRAYVEDGGRLYVRPTKDVVANSYYTFSGAWLSKWEDNR